MPRHGDAAVLLGVHELNDADAVSAGNAMIAFAVLEEAFKSVDTLDGKIRRYASR